MVPFRAWISCKTQSKTFASPLWKSALFSLLFGNNCCIFTFYCMKSNLRQTPTPAFLPSPKTNEIGKILKRSLLFSSERRKKNCDIITATTQIARVISPSRHKWAFSSISSPPFPVYVRGREGGKIEIWECPRFPRKKLKWVWRWLMGVRRWKVHFTSSSSPSASQKRRGNKLTPKWERGKTMCGRIFPFLKLDPHNPLHIFTQPFEKGENFFWRPKAHFPLFSR